MFNLVKKSTIAPYSFVEQKNHLMIGDKYVRVISIVGYPELFRCGLLSGLVTSSNFDIDIRVDSTDLDVGSTLKKQIEELCEKLDKAKEPQEIAKLKLKIDNIQDFVNKSVVEKSKTVNVITNIYVKADSLYDLDEATKNIRDELADSTLMLSGKVIPLLQQDYYKENSPLFVSSNLTEDCRYSNGLPMSSTSVAALFPFVFDTLENPKGTLIGCEYSNGGKVIFNQFLYEDYPQLAKQYDITAGNMIIVGRTGQGKTVLMNLILFNHLINHTKVIWLDPENKNAQLTRYVGGSYISFGNSNQQINIFDLKPISTDDTIVNYEEMYNTNLAISNVVEEIKITFKILWENISEDALSMINELVVDTYAAVGIDGSKSFEKLTYQDFPTFSDFSNILEQAIERYTNQKGNHERELNALSELKMKMRHITGYKGVPGEWNAYFNGHTTITQEQLENKLISFGTKALINMSTELQDALLRMVFNFAWGICLGNREKSVLAIDEEHMFIGKPYIAETLEIIQRRSRKYLTATLTGTQEIHDYCNPKIGRAGEAIFNNSSYQIFMNLYRNSIEDLANLIHITPEDANTIAELEPHCGLFFVGKKKIKTCFLATEEELSIIPK